MNLLKKIPKGFGQKFAKNRQLDSIQNSSGKSNHQAKGHWEDEQKAEQS